MYFINVPLHFFLHSVKNHIEYKINFAFYNFVSMKINYQTSLGFSKIYLFRKLKEVIDVKIVHSTTSLA